MNLTPSEKLVAAIFGGVPEEPPAVVAARVEAAATVVRARDLVPHKLRAGEEWVAVVYDGRIGLAVSWPGAEVRAELYGAYGVSTADWSGDPTRLDNLRTV